MFLTLKLGYNSASLRGLSLGLSVITHGKHLIQCFSHSEHSIPASFMKAL